jgi:mono/diheme cytochrome c family protein
MSGRLAFLVFFSIVILRAQGPPPARTVRDGVFTAAQAMRGEALYGMNCAKCHEGADVDGPPLTGDPFIDRWREDPLTSLFSFMKTRMPQDSPGKLTESAYLDILAWLLQENGHPAGSAELNAESVESTLLVGRDGPKPLPANTLVWLVGCLTSAAGDMWALTQSTDAARTRDGEQSTPEELKTAGSKAPGTKTFRLQNLDELKGGFNPGNYKGQRVLVKGVLIPQRNNERVNVTSLAPAGAGCGQ